MIKLKEIYHGIISEKNSDLSELGNWKISDSDFMTDMGFESGGQYHYTLKNPEIIVCHKKNVGFIVEDKKNNTTHTFKEFKELMEYFSKYEQKWDNTPYL